MDTVSGKLKIVGTWKMVSVWQTSLVYQPTEDDNESNTGECLYAERTDGNHGSPKIGSTETLKIAATISVLLRAFLSGRNHCNALLNVDCVTAESSQGSSSLI